MNFDLPLTHTSSEDWSMRGAYWTSIDKNGEHHLEFDAELKGPVKLALDKDHYVGWSISSS